MLKKRAPRLETPTSDRQKAAARARTRQNVKNVATARATDTKALKKEASKPRPYGLGPMGKENYAKKITALNKKIDIHNKIQERGKKSLVEINKLKSDLAKANTTVKKAKK